MKPLTLRCFRCDSPMPEGSWEVYFPKDRLDVWAGCTLKWHCGCDEKYEEGIFFTADGGEVWLDRWWNDVKGYILKKPEKKEEDSPLSDS